MTGGPLNHSIITPTEGETIFFNYDGEDVSDETSFEEEGDAEWPGNFITRERSMGTFIKSFFNFSLQSFFLLRFINYEFYYIF